MMGTRSKNHSNTRELVTEILDEARWRNALTVIVEFLGSKTVEEVRVEFAFVLDRDIAGQEQGQDQTVKLTNLERFIEKPASLMERSSEKGPRIFDSTRWLWNYRSCCVTTGTCILLRLNRRCLKGSRKCSGQRELEYTIPVTCFECSQLKSCHRENIPLLQPEAFFHKPLQPGFVE